MRLRPVYAILIVLVLVAGGVAANYAYQTGLHGVRFTRVTPDASGMVHINVADLGPKQVRFYRFLNAGNQEVKFLVARDGSGALQVAFDANDKCYRYGRGFHPQGDWVVCNKCEISTRLDQINEGHGGCSPIPLAFKADGDAIVVAQNDILKGWRLFN